VLPYNDCITTYQIYFNSYNLDIDLSIEVSGVDEAQAQNLIEAAHQVCPYSNATRGNIDVRLHVTVV